MIVLSALMFAWLSVARADLCSDGVGTRYQTTLLKPDFTSEDVLVRVREYRSLGASLRNLQRKWANGTRFEVARIEASFDVQDEDQAAFDAIGAALRGLLARPTNRLTESDLALIRTAMNAYDDLSMRRTTAYPPSVF